MVVVIFCGCHTYIEKLHIYKNEGEGGGMGMGGGAVVVVELIRAKKVLLPLAL